MSAPGNARGPSAPRRAAETTWRKVPAPAKGTIKFMWGGWARLTNQRRQLPDFIIIGTQRGGTTSMYNYLVAHPAVGRALTKEVRYFDLHFDRGPAWYRAQFPSLRSGAVLKRRTGMDRVVGEASPDYMFYPRAAARVADLLPSVKLIVVLRDPVERAYSHYWHQVTRGFESLSFEEAIAREPERLAGEVEKMLADEHYVSFPFHHHSYVARGIYVDQLERWMGTFPREQFLIVQSEAFYEGTANVMDEIFRFLDLPPWRSANYPTYNKMRAGSMEPSTREELRRTFAPHDERLSRFLNRDFGWNT